MFEKCKSLKSHIYTTTVRRKAWFKQPSKATLAATPASSCSTKRWRRAEAAVKNARLQKRNMDARGTVLPDATEKWEVNIFKEMPII